MTITILTSATIETKRRQPLKVIDMVTSQSPAQPPSSFTGAAGRPRKQRTSERLSLHKEASEVSAKSKGKKRKAGFSEDVEGFQFTRITSKRTRTSTDLSPSLDPAVEDRSTSGQLTRKSNSRKRSLSTGNDGAGDTKGQTPEIISKRAGRTNTKAALSEQEISSKDVYTARKRTEPTSIEKKRRKGRAAKSKLEDRNGYASPELQQAETTKISLPVADTPVIQRNKEMRTKKSGNGGRRSSLGMRGRRASSLIDSGASNALPHKEVDAANFYKHIASDLPEPRRMRQLLTWCATRAIGDKPSGTRSEDESARLAARMIQEELLKNFSADLQLSNWFDREDADPPSVIVKKPNPKNVQNTNKIKELEEQIQRLQQERYSLNMLLRPPLIPSIKPERTARPDEDNAQSPPGPARDMLRSDLKINVSLLDPEQQTILAAMRPECGEIHDISLSQGSPGPLAPVPPSAVSVRLSRISAMLAPTLDSFAAGLHDIELYRGMADAVSSRTLQICSERLEERDARNALCRLAIKGDEGEKDPRLRPVVPKEDLGLILGALSRAERK